VHLVAPGPSDLDAITWLLSYLQDVYEVLGATTAEFGSLTVNPDTPPMPAYTLIIAAQPITSSEES
jgi:hypothetical protein